MITEEKAHAKFSASGSERWLNCPGSIQLGMKAPEPPSSKYAEEGTKAHTLLETLLVHFIHTKDKTFKKIMPGVKKDYPKDMVDHVVAAAKRIISLVGPTDTLLCETKVSLEFLEPDTFGTVDAAIVDMFGTLTIIDFKYGAGHAVEVDDNTQLIYYALGLAHFYDYAFTSVKLMVDQPRAEHASGPLREYDMPIEAMYEWAKKFALGIGACKEENPELIAGAWCHYCRAKVICPEISKNALAKVAIEYDDLKGLGTMPEPLSMPSVSITTALNAIPHLKVWIKAVEAHAIHMLAQGENVDGFKLVNKKGIRKWRGESALIKQALDLFGPESLDTSLKSPAQLEKLSKSAKEFTALNAEAVSSGVTMAPNTDKRPAILTIDVKTIDFDVLD